MPLKSTQFLPLLVAASLAACAEIPTVRTPAAPRLALEQVTLDAEAARKAINSYRATRGLAPLEHNPDLTIAAQRHSDDLSTHDRISHRGSDGSNPWDRVKATGYKAKLAAENVGVGQRSFSEVLQGWKDSPGHNKNLLLPDATQMGVALVVNPASRNQTFWTLVMGTPARSRLAARPVRNGTAGRTQ